MVWPFRLAAKLIQQRPLSARILDGNNVVAIVGCQLAPRLSAYNSGVGDVQNGTSPCSGMFGVISPVSVFTDSSVSGSSITMKSASMALSMC